VRRVSASFSDLPSAGTWGRLLRLRPSILVMTRALMNLVSLMVLKSWMPPRFHEVFQFPIEWEYLFPYHRKFWTPKTSSHSGKMAGFWGDRWEPLVKTAGKTSRPCGPCKHPFVRSQNSRIGRFSAPTLIMKGFPCDRRCARVSFRF